jgi:hypothetical protein
MCDRRILAQKLAMENHMEALRGTPARWRACHLEGISGYKHVGQAPATHHGRWTVHFSKACSRLVLGVGEGSVNGLADKLHDIRTETPQGRKGYRAERVARAVMVGIVLPSLVVVTVSFVVGIAVGLAECKAAIGCSLFSDRCAAGEVAPW